MCDCECCIKNYVVDQKRKWMFKELLALANFYHGRRKHGMTVKEKCTIENCACEKEFSEAEEILGNWK